MDELNAVLNKLKELFITVRYKYIKQNNDGNGYQTFNAYENKSHKRLHDGFLVSHLMRENTYGIFCRKTHTKFLTFDVDIPDKAEAIRVVLALYESLNELGIPTDKIFTSWSGTKGYHVDIYFSKEIPYKSMEKLYNAAVKLTLNLLDGNINGQIEKRPSPTQGLKLPLSINFKNKNPLDNICWYVDVQNGFKPIRSLDFILTIQPIDADVLKDLINDLPNETDLSRTLKPVKKEISPDLTNLDLSEESPNSLASLYKNGIRTPNSRNASLCKLAIYFNTLKISKQECEHRLNEWMEKQDPKYYKTPLKTCYQEITRIVNHVYKKNLVLNEEKNEIVVSRSEMLTIYQYPKKLHLTINALLIHSKRFRDKNRQFYMTYEQIATAARCSKNKAIDHIKELEQLGLIKVTRNPISGLPENRPNTYELNLNWLEAEPEITVTVSVDKVDSYRDIRTTLIIKTFPNNEWWNINEILYKTKEQQAIKIQ
ncbi:helix-turn-helix domain-containing protein [Heyndrickxia sporothermodurans]|uniref:TOTE conflict system archaeo-eukaryotic primase domain-containing protein n=1 Tax=Heyndrickxia sporothermodurans TaxID=46224 RepID=UPI003D1FFF92